MKYIVTTLTLAFALFCDGGDPADTSSEDPSHQAALHYIQHLAKGDIDLTKHTALSPHCGLQRRKTIDDRISFFQKNELRQGDTFSIESSQVNNHLAAILVRAKNPAAPLSDRIHAVALVKNKNTWKPAPLLGSFANTGYGYDEQIEDIVRSLELWMAREKTLRETLSRKKALSEFKLTITGIEKNAGLDALSPEDAITHLLTQCRKKNLLTILACMGAASGQLLEPIETTIDIISQGLSNPNKSSEWYLMTNRSVIAQVMKVDKTRNEVALGFFNPMDRNHSRILYFPIVQSEGKTFVRLSHLLKTSLLPKKERRQQRWRQRRGDENELRKKVPAAILKNSAPVSYPTPEKLRKHFLRSIKNNDFTDALRLLPRKGDYFGDDDNQTTTLIDFGSIWQNISTHNLKSSPLPPVNILQEKSIALIPLQFAKPARPGQFETIKIWMLEDDDGWHIIGTPLQGHAIYDTFMANFKKLEKRFQSLEKEQQEKHSRNWLSKVVTLTPPFTLDPIKDDAAKTLFTDFRTHLRKSDTESALSKCAVLKGTNNIQTLKIFNYATRGAADHTKVDQILGISRSGKWLGVSARTTSKLTKLHDYPLYLIVNTAMGPKILLDVDLRHATNKGRKLLNTKNWRKLEPSLNKESLGALKNLWTQHQTLSTADIEELGKTHE
ncbi:MAG: hypothetical protein KJO21_08435 [Verrucomicrobiae bacterium]|nr:hypothetical protein [Verrucomicrobiae bacterium]NNJ43500.1 hypothetical protein [Akkermansiaceae bacterium]